VYIVEFGSAYMNVKPLPITSLFICELVFCK
jgi:hypothetical protein